MYERLQTPTCLCFRRVRGGTGRSPGEVPGPDGEPAGEARRLRLQTKLPRIPAQVRLTNTSLLNHQPGY